MSKLNYIRVQFENEIHEKQKQILVQRLFDQYSK